MPQRKMQPPKGYMTARRAKQLLGNISDGMLRTYITKGMIERLVPDTRSQGFYKMDDVKNLAARLGIHREIHFRQGMIDDLAECDDLLIKIFGGSNPVDGSGRPIAANPIERRASWITKNPETLFVLRAGDELVGCVFILPLSKQKIQQILASETTPAIFAEDMQSFTPGVPTHLYVMSACVYARDHTIATKRFYGSRLIHGLLSKVTELGRRGIELTTIVSRSESKDGIGLLRGVGCTEIESTTHWRNFFIDVSLSGIPDVKRYKRALAEYKLSHGQQTPVPSLPSIETPQREKATTAPVYDAHVQHSEMPPGTLTISEFAQQLGIARRTLLEQVQTYHLDHIALPTNRPGELKRFVTPEQQEAVRAWRAAHTKR